MIPDPWLDRCRASLARYDSALLRKIAGRLLRLRAQRSPEELINKIIEALTNAATIDRRLRELSEPSLGLLALMAQSRQPSWRLGNLLELLCCLGADDGLSHMVELLDSGFLFPEVGSKQRRLRRWDDWLMRSAGGEYRVFGLPAVTARSINAKLPLPDLDETQSEVGNVRETDGLDFFLRLGVLWQELDGAAIRLTQQGEFFKRDYDRLVGHAALNATPVDELMALPTPADFVAALALCSRVVRQEGAELLAGSFPAVWQEGLRAALTALWAALPDLAAWNAEAGWTGLNAAPGPYASARLVALALLGRLAADQWTTPEAVGRAIVARHPFWQGASDKPILEQWSRTFLLGVAFPLRLVQGGQDASGRWVVRLSDTGRTVLGLGPPRAEAAFPQTLLVQPNLEVIAYRQGLSPGLIADLSRFCSWKTLGAACTLRLEPERVYRGLESGYELEQMLQTLQRHGVRDLPSGAVLALRTWADKRERLTIYPSATILEFTSAEDLQAALGRGLGGLKLSDRLLLTGSDQDIDFRHFRLLGTRDYGLPPEQCIEVNADGVTLAIDLARADLTLESELQRFAEPITAPGSNGRKLYRLTPASLAQAQERGLSLTTLETWFRQRTGGPVTPAARLFLAAAETPPLLVRSVTVVQAASAETADGLMQWPATRALIRSRLGPEALAVESQDIEALTARLRELGITLRLEDQSPTS